MAIRVSTSTAESGPISRVAGVSIVRVIASCWWLLLTTFVSVALLSCGVAVADTVTTNFEAPTFHLGSVNGQDGWKSAIPGDIPSLPHGYDQAVVADHGAPPEFEGQSLRLSNAFNQELAGPPEFHFQTYSKPTTEAAGESLPNTEYTALFSFISAKPTVEQKGLFVSVSPDEGEGGRMSYIGLEEVPANMETETPAGIDVTFYDTNAEGEFVGYDLGVLPRDKPHTIKFWMRLVPGPDNDLVRISIDGHDVGQCFTTWENFYRAVSQPVPISDTLEFRSTGEHENLSLAGGGYLFDNVSITTAKGAGPPTCELPLEKEAETRTARPGGLVRYRISFRNRGRLSARNVLVCDRIPRVMTFMSANRKLLRLGSRRCLLTPNLAPGQRVTFHPVLRVNANAPPGNAENIVEEIPGGEPPGTPPPGAEPPGVEPPHYLPLPAPLLAGLPADAKTASAPPANVAKAMVKILARRPVTSPPAPPVTG